MGSRKATHAQNDSAYVFFRNLLTPIRQYHLLEDQMVVRRDATRTKRNPGRDQLPPRAVEIR
jgi:hypothetical protein